MAQKLQEESKEASLRALKWMVRPCEVYEDEYDNCTSIKSRFHQYFIYGETIDCKSWKTDHRNCLKWSETDDIKVLEQLIASEEKRRAERLMPHYANDVWKKRIGPPPDWNKPLPAWLEEKNKVSYLSLKAEELRNGAAGRPISAGERSICVIS